MSLPAEIYVKPKVESICESIREAYLYAYGLQVDKDRWIYECEKVMGMFVCALSGWREVDDEVVYRNGVSLGVDILSAGSPAKLMYDTARRVCTVELVACYEDGMIDGSLEDLYQLIDDEFKQMDWLIPFQRRKLG